MSDSSIEYGFQRLQKVVTRYPGDPDRLNKVCGVLLLDLKKKPVLKGLFANDCVLNKKKRKYWWSERPIYSSSGIRWAEIRTILRCPPRRAITRARPVCVWLIFIGDIKTYTLEKLIFNRFIKSITFWWNSGKSIIHLKNRQIYDFRSKCISLALLLVFRRNFFGFRIIY